MIDAPLLRDALQELVVQLEDDLREHLAQDAGTDLGMTLEELRALEPQKPARGRRPRNAAAKGSKRNA
jgi:hypothetical protein